MISNKTHDRVFPELTDFNVIEVFLKRALGTCLTCNEQLIIEDSYSLDKVRDLRNADFIVECKKCTTQFKFEI